MIKHALTVAVIAVLGGLLYHQYQIWYAEPMAELEHDELVLQLEQEVVKASKIKADTFEQNESAEKLIIWRTNENLHIKDVGTDFSDGNHSIRL